jgi:hypothetical protein
MPERQVPDQAGSMHEARVRSRLSRSGNGFLILSGRVVLRRRRIRRATGPWRRIEATITTMSQPKFLSPP